ncbi:very short patch repair endonuclease [uncultured Bacteroides sp.]|uniref:very short patch repair endonuclease n=1 Tax=uncultured Bacteroides sp. TaxID=162156 RepID=UPI00260D2FEF|nr:very short patch repair endonuclease [uncultured Bacteroides sp.]
MADKLTKEQRHKCMSHIRSKDTKPEIIVRKYLFSKGFRFRIHVKNLPGTPDIVLKKYRTVIFINGCFWHGHENCKYSTLPTTNTDFWKEKIEKNKQRDLKERIELRNLGWHVIQLWECQLKPKVREENLEGLVYTLNKMMLLNFKARLYKTFIPDTT